jgi:hypothetical protein
MLQTPLSVLFEVEQDRSPHRVLRISGRASVRTEQQAQRSYGLRAARKYLLTLGAIRNALAHIRQLPLRLNYIAQGVEKGQPCVIEVIPLEAEFLNDEQQG